MRLRMFESADTENGFTLVEILVALVILLLVVTACLPLFTMAAKVTYENKARMTATQIAKQELERTLAQTNANNYNNENDTDPGGAPLKTGVTGSYAPTLPDGTPDPNLSNYQIRKIVSWIDDPDDDKHPSDTLPFDYKQLTIEVTCPSIFTGAVTKHADFKTFVAKEGSTSPITGIVVEVVRGWTDDDGKRIPVEGATVTLEGNTSSKTAVTNEAGQAMFPMTFPDDNTVYSYQVECEYSGMILRPDMQAVAVEARPYTTSFVQIEMEYPATLSLRFAPSLKDTAVTLDGHTTMGSTTKVLNAGDTALTFSDLWPAGTAPDNPAKVCSGGTYSLSIGSMVIHRTDISTADAGNYLYHQISTEEQKNLWTLHANYNGSPAWVADDANYPSGTAIFASGAHRLAFPDAIDLSSFKPAISTVQAELSLAFIIGENSDSPFSISGYNSLPDVFSLLYLGEADADLTMDDGWSSLIQMQTDTTSNSRILTDANSVLLATELNGELANPQEIDITSEYFSNPFFIRFDSDPSIDRFYFRDIEITCRYNYNGSIQFTGPDDRLQLKISGN